jgi:lantibiotic transport system ATP-binding protein
MENYVIATDKITRRFGALTAVDHLDLHVPQGAVYGFLGPNGSGKTTTIRMLLGLIKPNEGTVRLFDHPLRENRIDLLRRVGALVETPSLYPHLTGRENLELTRRLIGGVSRSRINAVLHTVRLEAAANRLAKGYSLGMKQRLGLALALLSEPALLILDEPTNGLDPAGIQEMRDLIREMPVQHGITVFLSSHLLSEVEQIASHIGIVHRGKLVFEGTLTSLQAQREEYLALGVDQPEAAHRILAEAGWTTQPNSNGTLRIAAVKSEDGVRINKEDAARINSLLIGQGVNVYHLALQQPTLEQTFLDLTDMPDGERSL